MSEGGARTRARGYALQVLYGMDVSDTPEVERAIRGFWDSFEQEEQSSVVAFADDLVRATARARGELDAIIQSASRNWRLERMSRVDRNILRLATCELLGHGGAPARVAINEAVELAKRFGAAESPAFVNGILDRVAQSLPAPEPT